MAYALRSRLIQGVNDISRRCQLSRRLQAVNVELQSRYFANGKELDAEAIQKPVKFTTSLASKESAKFAREKSSRDDSPWSQTISLGLSLGAFLVYFGILREPNDLDNEIDRDLYGRVPDLLEVQKKLGTSAGKAAARAIT